jgi:hypothetical protein
MTDEKKYYLFERHLRRDYIVEELSLNQVQLLNRCHEILYEFGFYTSKVKIIDLSINEYIEKTAKYQRELSIKKPEDMEIFYDIFTDINRLFINVVSSVRSYIEFVEKRLEKNYSKTSTEYISFIDFTHYLYDRYFSYRFLYHIRNYAIHNYFPINTFNVDYDYDKKGNITNSTFRIEFDKRRLSEDSKIKAKLKYDLKTFNDTFPVYPLFEEIEKFINEVERKIFGIEFNRFNKAFETLNFYYEKSIFREEVHYGEKIQIINKINSVKHIIIRRDLLKRFESYKRNFT